MDYCQLIGQIYVFGGTILFAIGGLIATYGWNIWCLQSDKKKLLRKGVCTIVLGTIGVAFAGLLTTHGWNLISLGKQRNNLIRAFAQELRMNVLRLESPPIKGELYYRKENGGLVQRPFPTLKTTALNAVLSSGLWDFGNDQEEKLLKTITGYEIAIGVANRFFGVYNDLLSKIIDPNEKIALAKKSQKVAPEKDYFKALDGAQNKVIKILLSEHKCAIPSKERELLLQRIREKSTVSKPE